VLVRHREAASVSGFCSKAVEMPPSRPDNQQGQQQQPQGSSGQQRLKSTKGSSSQTRTWGLSTSSRGCCRLPAYCLQRAFLWVPASTYRALQLLRACSTSWSRGTVSVVGWIAEAEAVCPLTVSGVKCIYAMPCMLVESGSAGTVITALLVRSQRLQLFLRNCERCMMHICGAMHAS
jgi:hypothetical protein